MPNSYKMILSPKEFKEISETGKLISAFMTIEFSEEEKFIFAQILQSNNELKEIIVESSIEYNFAQIINSEVLSKVGEKLIIRIQEKQNNYSGTRVAEYL